MAEIQRVKELVLAYPAAFVHQFAMHQGDLPGRTAETEAADPRAHAHQLGEIGCVQQICTFTHERPIHLRPAKRAVQATLGLLPWQNA